MAQRRSSTPRASAPTFYYADGHRVPLTVSDHFVAMRSEQVREDAGAAATAVADAVAPDHVLTLPDLGLVVLHVPNGDGGGDGARRAVAAAGRAAAGHDGVAAGPPVYEPVDTARELGLIPTGRVIVRFDDTTDEATREALREELDAVLVDADGPGGTLIWEVDADRTLETANRLHESDGVTYAEPDFVELAPRPAGTTAAPASDDLIDLVTAATDGALATDPHIASQWGLTRIRAHEAWGISTGSPSITVAVLDEGCDTTHEDVSYTVGWDAFANDADPRPVGNDAHGTACAGIVAMQKDNGVGGAGVAPRSRIVPIRLAEGIGGGFWSTSSSIVATAIYRAVALGASVLSNSYSVAPSSTVTAAFQHAANAGRGGLGCVSAAATGNDDVSGVIYPARLSPSIRGFLAVGASNQWDQRKSKTSADGEHWWGSNTGPEVDVVAPGVRIFTTDITGGAGYSGGNYAPTFNGTSSATPHVAGLAALILAVDPQLRGWEVEEIVKRTARDLGTGGRDEQFGYGRIDARRALEAASKLWYRIDESQVFLGRDRACFVRLRVRIYNPGINTVRLDGLTVRSHTTDWSTELDRFEYRPTGTTGNVLRPHSRDEVVFDRILLPANGTQRTGWATRWSASWSYTFWRPSAPGLPLVADPGADPLDATPGTTSGDVEAIRGGEDGETPTDAEVGAGAYPAHGEPSENGHGDLVDVDRSNGRITIVIR